MLLQRFTVPSGIRSSLSLKASSASAFTRCSPYSTQPPEPKAKVPLRILFCGSDLFSCYSLKALHAEHKANPGLIKSIDVMVRPGKAMGRGYKEIRQVPIQSLAEELSLPIHIRDTFTGWSLPQRTAGPDGGEPEPINLIVAVSFGLFVPPRILNQAKYGGLNVHPSLLPNLRGPAPLHHALLSRLSYTGVSVQTLSPQTFDAGTVIAQTPLPGVPIPQNCTVQQLHDLLAPLGAEMLVSALREGRHVPPLSAVVDNRIPEGGGDLKDGRKYAHAPKITKSDQRVSFLGHSSSEAALRARVCGGSLWTNVYPPVPAPKGPRPPKAGSEGSTTSESQDTVLGQLELQLPLTYPHPLEESTKGFPKRIILEEVSELFSPPPEISGDAGDAGGLEQQYQAYQRIVQAMNFGTVPSTTGNEQQLGLDDAAFSFQPTNNSESSPPENPRYWLLRFGEDEYVDIETTGANGEKATERKPRVSWGLCTRLGLDGRKEEDKGAVAFVMKGEEDGRFGLLRVGKIKVEGKAAKPAREVMKDLAVRAG
ncbi:methionyl-tRNA formyltransferase [Pseudoneurospora amorphoporcata]|uniref:methionyl-tRNA formyltransferase n=1 Tax=Pseudoneurospora amorphoporcata TaxID=241081 RepID=A0AAN6SJW1_9PEZI|nr:methionyl-tRNA formyltransferase [Pseudoneurospora amorphoporcata]